MPIPNPTQIRAWNIAKAAIIMRQVRSLQEWNLVCGCYTMGATYNFVSWWPPHMLIIWQPVKTLRDLSNSKGSAELSATSVEILVSGVDQKCFCTWCLHTAHKSPWDRYKIQQCQSFNAAWAHTYCWGKCHPLACHTTAESAFRGSQLSKFLFFITCGCLASYYNQQHTFSCRVVTSSGTCSISL